MNPCFFLIRGIPGSGKSTYARQLIETFAMMTTEAFGSDIDPFLHYEADMYFMDGENYKYDPKKIVEAHSWCQKMTRDGLLRNRNVVVANTMLTLKEMDTYLRMGQEFQIDVTITTMTGDYGSVHGVPVEKMDQMRQRLVTPAQLAVEIMERYNVNVQMDQFQILNVCFDSTNVY